MPNSSEAAEQLVRIYLDGVEVALKISGVAAKNVATALYAISQDKNKTKGKIRLSGMLKTGKELKIFSVKKEDLKKFSQEAKRYGVLYCALMDNGRTNPDGLIDIMVRAEDASKINRIVERFNLNTLSSAEIKSEIAKTREENGQGAIQKGVQEKNIEDVKKEQHNKDIAKIEKGQNDSPSFSRAERNNQSKNFSESKKNLEAENTKEQEKTSVREELKDIKEELDKKSNSKEKIIDENVIDKTQKIKSKNTKERY